MNGAMGQGYVPAAQPGYPGQEPVPRAKKRRSIGGIIFLILAVIVMILAIGGFIAIDYMPGDPADGRAWLGVVILLYVVPFSLMLAVCGLILVCAARSRSR